VVEDLEHIEALRKYLLLGRKLAVPGRDLIEASTITWRS
jgi:hypothetical protein